MRLSSHRDESHLLQLPHTAIKRRVLKTAFAELGFLLKYGTDRNFTLWPTT